MQVPTFFKTAANRLDYYLAPNDRNDNENNDGSEPQWETISITAVGILFICWHISIFPEAGVVQRTLLHNLHLPFSVMSIIFMS
jgi:hypothetical protein